ncbi:MAG: hypothetical protein WAX89_01965 [Alphaproteobacteria bacterium]
MDIMNEIAHLTTRTWRWYANPNARLGRGWFNTILLVAFLPTLYWQYAAMQHAANSFNALLQPQHGGSTTQQLQALQGLLHAPASASATGIGLPELFPYIVYAILLPIVLMRLRDTGWHWAWALLIYIPLGLDFATLVAKATFPALLTWPLAIASLIVITKLSSVPSKQAAQNEKVF